MENVEKNIFLDINSGYIKLTNYFENFENNDTNTTKKKRNDFLNGYSSLINSCNYMGMDVEISRVLSECILANGSTNFICFIKTIVFLSKKLKEESYSHNIKDLRNEASVDFLINNISPLESLLEPNSDIEELMFDVYSKTHKTIFQSFIRCLSITIDDINSKLAISDFHKDINIKDEDKNIINKFIDVFDKSENIFPFV